MKLRRIVTEKEKSEQNRKYFMKNVCANMASLLMQNYRRFICLLFYSGLLCNRKIVHKFKEICSALQ